MGNKPIKIAVRLDQDVCEAGQVVTGKVYLSIGIGADVRKFRGIHLLLNGVERSSVAVSPGTLEYDSRRRNGRPLVETSGRTVARVDYPLVDLTGISRGQYEYPFQLPLRDDLPSSLRCSLGDRDRSFCEIKYTLTAYVSCEGVVDSSIESKLSHELLLRITGAPSNPPEGPRPIRTETEIFPITCCWFWSQGRIVMGWSSSCSVAAPGDNVHVQIWGENQSKLVVDYLSVKWMETVEWHSEPVGGGGLRKVSTRLLAEQRHSVAPEHPQWRSKRTLSPSHEALLRENDHPPLISTLKIPSNARESHEGRLVEVRHTLVICVLTSGGYSSSTPESSFTVRIIPKRRHTETETTETPAAEAMGLPSVAPSAPSEFYDDVNQQPIVEAQALPADWNPVESDVVSLPVASAVVVSDESTAVSQTPVAGTSHALMDEGLVVLPPPDTDRRGIGAMNAKLSEAASPDTPSAQTGNDANGELDQLAKLVSECPENLPVILEDPAWAAVVQRLSPREFGNLVQTCSAGNDHLSTSSEASTIAHGLAVRMGPSFQTKHLLACLWILPCGGNRRMALLKDVAPLASDIASKRTMIEEELTSQELVVFLSAVSESG